MGCTIIGCGKALPALEVENDELAKLVDTNDEWIVTRTGISSRHVAVGETGTDLAETAARAALGWSQEGWCERSLAPEDIDLVIVATITPDALVPSAAGLLRERLGLEHAIAFDLNAACTGFIYGLTVAESMMAACAPGFPGAPGRNPVRRALVVGDERLTHITDWADRSTCVLFGDAAGAAVYERDETADLCVDLGSRGNLEIEIQGCARPEPSVIKMNGNAVFRFAVGVIPSSLNRVMEKAGLTMDQIDWVVCHQANARIIDHCAKKLGAPEKFYKNIDRYGNTSAASIPVALNELAEAGRLQSGMRVACIGFGGGLTWGGMLITVKGSAV